MSRKARRISASIVRSSAGPHGEPYGVLLHATARAEKEWPEANWRMLAGALGTGIDLLVPYGTDAERERAARIAAATPRARVSERAPLDQVARLIAGASFVVGVDTGLLHLARRRSACRWSRSSAASKPGLTGPMGAGPITVLGEHSASVPVVDVVDAVQRWDS